MKVVNTLFTRRCRPAKEREKKLQFEVDAR